MCCKLDVEKCCVAVATKMKGSSREKKLENTGGGGSILMCKCFPVFLRFKKEPFDEFLCKLFL